MRQDPCARWFSNWKGHFELFYLTWAHFWTFQASWKFCPLAAIRNIWRLTKRRPFEQRRWSGLSLAWHYIFQCNRFHRRREAPAAVTFSIPIVDSHYIKMHACVRKKKKCPLRKKNLHSYYVNTCGSFLIPSSVDDLSTFIAKGFQGKFNPGAAVGACREMLHCRITLVLSWSWDKWAYSLMVFLKENWQVGIPNVKKINWYSPYLCIPLFAPLDSYPCKKKAGDNKFCLAGKGSVQASWLCVCIYQAYTWAACEPLLSAHTQDAALTAPFARGATTCVRCSVSKRCLPTRKHSGQW